MATEMCSYNNIIFFHGCSRPFKNQTRSRRDNHRVISTDGSLCLWLEKRSQNFDHSTANQTATGITVPRSFGLLALPQFFSSSTLTQFTIHDASHVRRIYASSGVLRRRLATETVDWSRFTGSAPPTMTVRRSPHDHSTHDRCCAKTPPLLPPPLGDQ